MKEFRRMVHKIVENDHMPDYHLAFDEYERDKLIVISRQIAAEFPIQNGLFLKPQTMENAAPSTVASDHVDPPSVETSTLRIPSRATAPP